MTPTARISADDVQQSTERLSARLDELIPEEQRASPASYGTVLFIFKQFNALLGRIGVKNTERNDRLDALEQRCAALETKASGVEYGGVFDSTKSYQPGVLVTRDGGLWLALSASCGAVPGTDRAAWKLIVKSGGARCA